MEFRQSRLLFLLFVFAWLGVGRGNKSAVWEGQSATLQCADKVNETFDRIWMKYEKGNWETAVAWFHGQADFMVPYNSPLNTENVTMNDDGSLEIANASYPKSSGIFKYTNGHIECVVTFSVYQKMKSLTLHGFENMILENSDVSFTCTVEGGYPAPMIAWEIPDTVLMPDVNSSAYQSMITLTVSKDQNYQDLKCRASIFGQCLVEGYRFNISYKPIVNITTLGKQAFFTEGETETLVCSAKGNPKPEITWMHGGRPLIDDKKYTSNLYDGDSEGEAVFHSITVKFDPNSRSYSCTATNTVGSARAFITLTGLGWILIGLVGAVAALGLTLIIAGMWICYRQSALCRHGKQKGDIDVDSQGYQSQIAVARFFESNRLTRSIGSAQSCRNSGSSQAVGDLNTDDSSEYLHPRSTPAPGAAGQDNGAPPKQFEAVAEVHYLPMDGSAKLTTRKQETARFHGSMPTMVFKNMSFPDTYGSRGRDLVFRESFNSVVYANQPRTARQSDENVPQETAEVAAENHYLPMDGSAMLTTTRKETDDSSEYLHTRSTPAPGTAGQDIDAQPKQSEVAAEIHYLPMDGTANLTATRKETDFDLSGSVDSHE